MSQIDFSDLLRDYLDEAHELIAQMNERIMELEAQMREGHSDPETINELFRLAHTLKGISGMAGQQTIADLTHQLESVLDQLRLGKLRPSERLVQAIFDSVDTLDVLIRQLETGGEDGHDRATQLTAQLEELLSAPTAEPSLTLDDLPLTPEVKDVLTEYEEARVLENLRGGKRIYEVTIPFNIENFEEALEQINQALKPLGELIARAPLPDAPTGYDLSCVILLASDADSHAIETAVERWNATVRDVMQGDGAPTAPMEVTVQAEVEEVKTPPTPAPSEAPAETPTPSKREPPVEEQPPVAQHHVAPTIRVDVQRLDRLLNLVGELVVIRSRYISLTRNLRDAFGEGELIEELERTNRFFNRRLDELRDGIFKARMIPIGQIFSRFPRVVRDVARVANKEVRLKMEGAETELDKAVVDAIVDPLVHLVRNAVDHGIESSEERVRAGKPRIGTIWLRARQEGNMILIEVADDGKGIDLERIRQRAIERGWLSPDIPITMREALEFLCQPGFSTATQITEISGRGVGLDVVKQVVETLGGTLDIESQRGAGTTFRIRLPLTLAIIPALLVRVAQSVYALPLTIVDAVLRLQPHRVQQLSGLKVYQLNGKVIPLLHLRELFKISHEVGSPSKEFLVTASVHGTQVGLVVDELLGQQEIVIKALGPPLDRLEGIAGVTELGDGRLALILDAAQLTANYVRHVRRIIPEVTEAEAEEHVQQLQLFTFALGGQAYGALVEQVSEVLRPCALTRVPTAPEFIEGVVEWREMPVPVVDLRKRLGLDTSEWDRWTRFVVADLEGQYVAFIVDRVLQILSIATEQIQPVTVPLPPRGREMVKGVCRWDEGLLLLLDLAHILEPEEKGMLSIEPASATHVDVNM